MSGSRSSLRKSASSNRGVLTAFRNLYAFLLQVIPYQDSELEKLYALVRSHIARKVWERIRETRAAETGQQETQHEAPYMTSQYER